MKARFMIMAVAVLLSGTSFTLSAQTPKQHHPAKKNYRAMQCEQIVRTLMLDDATTARFTPVYEKYMTEMRAIRSHPSAKKATPRTAGEATKPAVKRTPTDSEVEQSIKDQFAQSRKMLDVREKYYTEFRKILSPKQIQRIYQIEKQNTAKAQKEWKKRHDRKSANKNGHGSNKREHASTSKEKRN